MPSSASMSSQPWASSSALRSSFSLASSIRSSMTCPPENPIETRSADVIGVPPDPLAGGPSVGLRRLNDLGQHPARRARMQEGDAGVEDPQPRLRVDQPHSGVLELRQDLVDVADGVRDVVQAGSSLLEELADGSVRPERPQQLDVPVADVEQHRLDALRFHRLAMGKRHAQGLLVEGDGPLEVVGGDADVIDPAEHGQECIAVASPTIRRNGSGHPTQVAAAMPPLPDGAASPLPASCSTRRISRRALTPTSSCSGVGSLVAIRRWISWPGRWKARAAVVSGFRSLQANISAASDALATPTAARATGPGRSN